MSRTRLAVNLIVLCAAATLAAAQTQSAKGGSIPRMPDGKPDFQGFWSSKIFAPADDVEDHPVDRFEIRAGKSIIVDPPGGTFPTRIGLWRRGTI